MLLYNLQIVFWTNINWEFSKFYNFSVAGQFINKLFIINQITTDYCVNEINIELLGV